jgi:hypothetical protein
VGGGERDGRSAQRPGDRLSAWGLAALEAFQADLAAARAIDNAITHLLQLGASMAGSGGSATGGSARASGGGGGAVSGGSGGHGGSVGGKYPTNPRYIHFTQSTVNNQGQGYTVLGNIQQLRANPSFNLPAIRIFLIGVNPLFRTSGVSQLSRSPVGE